VAAPAYQAKRRELRGRNVVITVVACLCLLVPTVGSFYPVPPYPTDIFPYIFAAYMAVGGGWLFIVSRRQRGILAGIEAELEQTLRVHGHEREAALDLAAEAEA